MINLKPYQEKAVEKLKTEVNDLLNYPESKICVFSSPTGSGKTLMMAESLKRLVTHRDDNKKFSFIWIAVNKLHTQSKDKLEQFFEDTRTLKCSRFEDLEDKRIQDNEILFFNWASINKTGNVYVRENEQDNNLSKIIENTKEDDREIVLIIDESHHTAGSDKSKEIILEIEPNVTVEVSATPKMKEGSHLVEVNFADVILDEMIKKEIGINPELDKEKAKESEDELIIDSALKKREELKKQYEAEGSNVNPLLLIQLPDKKGGVTDKKDGIIKYLKEKHNITFENRKLGVYLTGKEDKINLENISKEDNDVEVLIFKQAISVGWDCPRASILVLFRDMKSIIFSIQTIGRIMRMPELKHYDSEDLNKGYVYTNLGSIKIAEDIVKDYITVFDSFRNDKIYKNIDLYSIYLKRQREKTRLSGEFSKIFLSLCKKKKLEEKITDKPADLINPIMVDASIERLDKAQIVTSDKKLEINVSDVELQYRYDLFIRSVCHPYAPADSSGRIKTAIYKAFEKILGLDDWEDIQKLVLSEKNNSFVVDLINEAKEDYKEKVVETLSESREMIETKDWNVPKLISYTKGVKKGEYFKNIMDPTYYRSHSGPEKDFIEILEEKDNNIVWWFKNGESEIKWFAVKYVDEKGYERELKIE